MRQHNTHILRVVLLLWVFSMPLMAKENKAHATQFHAPKQQAALPQWLQSLEQPRQQQQQFRATRARTGMPAPQRQAASGPIVPTVSYRNTLLDKPYSAIQPTQSTTLPQAQMHSVATKLRETHTAPSTSGTMMMAGGDNPTQPSGGFNTAAITPVGAGNAAPLYGLVTPVIRKGPPPGTGGGDPENPDIPVPVGSGLLPLCLAALCYCFRKKREE